MAAAPRDPPPPPGRLRGRLRPDEMYPAGPEGSARIAVRFVPLADGRRVRVLSCGEGPALVFLHGWGASAYTFRRATLGLADSGFRVIVPEMLGHGLSDKPVDRKHYTVTRFAAQVREVLDALGVRTFAVAGHSMGGGVALELALTSPRHVTHLALLGAARVGHVYGIWLLHAFAPGARLPFYPRLVTRFGVKQLLRRVYGRGHAFTERDVDEYWAPSQYSSYVPAVLRMAQAFDWSLESPERLQRLRVPTLVMVADDDWVVSPDGAAAAARAIEGATLVTVPGAGHLFPEAHAEETIAAMRDLLARPPAAATRELLASNGAP